MHSYAPTVNPSRKAAKIIHYSRPLRIKYTEPGLQNPDPFTIFRISTPLVKRLTQTSSISLQLSMTLLKTRLSLSRRCIREVMAAIFSEGSCLGRILILTNDARRHLHGIITRLWKHGKQEGAEEKQRRSWSGQSLKN